MEDADHLKTDAAGSAVPFAREFAAYLSHCRKAGGLTLACCWGKRYKRSPFKAFYSELNKFFTRGFLEDQVMREERGEGREFEAVFHRHRWRPVLLLARGEIRGFEQRRQVEPIDQQLDRARDVARVA